MRSAECEVRNVLALFCFPFLLSFVLLIFILVKSNCSCKTIPWSHCEFVAKRFHPSFAWISSQRDFTRLGGFHPLRIPNSSFRIPHSLHVFGVRVNRRRIKRTQIHRFVPHYYKRFRKLHSERYYAGVRLRA